jgi:hypothetical protein
VLAHTAAAQEKGLCYIVAAAVVVGSDTHFDRYAAGAEEQAKAPCVQYGNAASDATGTGCVEAASSVQGSVRGTQQGYSAGYTCCCPGSEVGRQETWSSETGSADLDAGSDGMGLSMVVHCTPSTVVAAGAPGTRMTSAGAETADHNP